MLLWHLKPLAELELCCLLKIPLSPSSHFVPSGIWASGILAMDFIISEYLSRTLQAPEPDRNAGVHLYIIYKRKSEHPTQNITDGKMKATIAVILGRGGGSNTKSDSL